MQKFQTNPAVLAGRDSRKLIRMYNKMAKTLVEFETLWYQAWVSSIETVKSGLQATLIIKCLARKRGFENGPSIMFWCHDVVNVGFTICVPKISKVIFGSVDAFCICPKLQLAM